MKPEWFFIGMLAVMVLGVLFGSLTDAYLAGIWLVLVQIWLRVARVK